MDNSTLDLVFPAVGGREVVSRNDGGDITSDAGLLLVSLADKKLGLTQAMADAFTDNRDQGKVVHGVIEMARERIYAICQDYEDANDLDTLRYDPALKTACKRLPKTGEALASQPTISRFENMPGAKDQARMAVAIAHRVISGLTAQTSRVIVDVDPTEGPCHGQQEFEFFNAHYGCHYLSAPVQIDACLKYKWEGSGCREYGSVSYKAGSWRHARRVVVKAEITQGDLNPRFVVTSLDNLSDVEAYEFYCGRGEQENRIKENPGPVKRQDELPQLSCQSVQAADAHGGLHTDGSVAGCACRLAVGKGSDRDTADEAAEGRGKGRGNRTQDMVSPAKLVSRPGCLETDVCGAGVRLI
jgi:hypothetical protein